MRKPETSEGIVVQRVGRKDLSRVFELISEAFPTEISLGGFDPRRLKRLVKLYSILNVFFTILDFLHINFETILVAVADGQVVGELHLVPQGKGIWSLDSSAVDRKFRGRGIYRRLMRESLRYISQRHGEKIVTSLWATNVPAVKITSELRFQTLEEKTLLIRGETNETSLLETKGNAEIRELKQHDIEQVFGICKTLDPKRTEVYNVTPGDFLGTSLMNLRNKMVGFHSKQWVLVVKGQVAGYVKVSYTSVEEAGSIESFYVLSVNNSSELTGYFLKYVLTFLANRNIRRVVTALDREWRETIQTFERFGFKPVATVYERVRWLN